MDDYLATIKLFAGDYAPKNWMFCDGKLLEIAKNQALFVLLTITYGGDGKVTFALPDLRKAAPAGEYGPKYIICTDGRFPPRD